MLTNNFIDNVQSSGGKAAVSPSQPMDDAQFNEWAKSPTVAQPESKGLLSNAVDTITGMPVSSALKMGASNIVNTGKNIIGSATEGVKQFGSGFEQVQKGEESKNPGEGAYNMVSGAGQMAAGGINTALSPISGAMKSVGDIKVPGTEGNIGDIANKPINWLADNISNIPALQHLAVKYPGLQQDLSNAITIGGALVGGEKAPEIKTATGEAVTAGKQIAQSGLQGIEKGTEVVGNVAKTINENTIKPIATKIAGTSSNLANSLEESSLRLTPVQKTNLGSKLQEVVDYNTKNGITGSPETRYEKITENYDKMENSLQKTLDSNPNITIPKQSVIDQLESIKNNYANDRDINAIERQIDDAKSVLDRQPDNIPLKNINELKRSTYAGAYNNAGVKVLDTVEHDIGDVLRTTMNDTLDKSGVTIDGKSLNDFNKEYGTVITSRKLLKIAQGRPQLGLVGKLTSRVIGGIIGGAVGGGIPGEIAGSLVAPNIAEHIAGTNVKSNIAGLLKKK